MGRDGTWEADVEHTFRLPQRVVDLDGFDGLPGVEQLHPLATRRLMSTSQ